MEAPANLQPGLFSASTHAGASSMLIYVSLELIVLPSHRYKDAGGCIRVSKPLFNRERISL